MQLKKNLECLMDIMDIGSEGFFQHQYDSYIIFAYVFEIPSEYGRGKLERLMLAVMDENDHFNNNAMERTFKEWAEEFHKIPLIFKGLYLATRFEDAIARDQWKNIREIIKRCHDYIYHLVPSEKFGYIYILGPSSSGKTTLLSKIYDKYIPNGRPTLGIQIISGIINQMKFHIYDTGGQIGLWDLSLKTFELGISNSKQPFFIYVLDCNDDHFRLDMCREYFDLLTSRTGKLIRKNRIPMLIVGNKRDLGIKLYENDIEKLLSLKKNYDFYRIILISAIKGEGIDLVLKWIVDMAINPPEDVKKWTVFISYSHQDLERFKVEQIVNYLSHESEFKDVLYSQADVKENFIEYMNDNLSKCDLMLLFCSSNTKDSKYVKMEWSAALANDKPIVPVFETVEDIPPLLRSYEGVKFNALNLESVCNSLKNQIKKRLEK